MEIIALKENEVLVEGTIYKKTSEKIVLDPVGDVYVSKELLQARGKPVIKAKSSKSTTTVPTLFYNSGVICSNKDGSQVMVATVQDANTLNYHEGPDGNFYQHIPDINPGKVRYIEFDNTTKKKKASREEALALGAYSTTFKRFEGKKYTFGVEIETSCGAIPGHAYKALNLKCVYDGSLRTESGEVYGGEYVTGVLTGDAGVMHLHRILKTISKYCQINPKCGVHIHVGGADFTEEFNVYAYILGQLLEKELEEMMPASRRSNEYCKRLPKLNLHKYLKETNKEEYKLNVIDAYNTLFREVSAQGQVPSTRWNKKTNHPLGAHCNHNRSTMRYCWLNFVPSMFNIRGAAPTSKIPYTLEFRNHSATLQFFKTVKWLQICMGFVYFVENHKQDILRGRIATGTKSIPITLQNVMKTAYPLSYKPLCEYIQKRVDTFADSSAEKKEYLKSSNENTPLTLKEAICA